MELGEDGDGSRKNRRGREKEGMLMEVALEEGWEIREADGTRYAD